MRIDCLVENIEKATPFINKVIPINTQVPILSNICIQANSNGFFLSATDLEIGIQAKIPAKIEEEGAVTVPGKHFIEVIHALPKDKLNLVKEKDLLLLTLRDHKVTFQTLPQEEFPSIFEEKGEKVFSFEAEELRSVFSPVVFCTINDEAKPVLSGILLSQEEGDLHVAATDGYRLSLKKIKGKLIEGEMKKMVVSARLINELLTLKGAIDMFVYAKGNQVVFEAENMVFVGRFLEGEFPRYERVIPTGYKTRIVFEKEGFLQILKLSSVFARESANVVRLKVKDGVLTLLSRSQGVGEGEMNLEVEHEGEGNEIVFNIKFLLDLLRNTPEKRMIMEMNTPFEPGVFRFEKDPSFLHVIMPVRVQE